MNIRFVEEARDEFLDALSSYERIRGCLGQRFKLEVERRLTRISNHEDYLRLGPGEFRRINLRGFPFYIP